MDILENNEKPAFEREERYIVVKLKRINKFEQDTLREFLQSWQIPTEQCVVVEHDWPNYEHTWETIRRVSRGTFTDPYAEAERYQRLYDDLYDATEGVPCANTRHQQQTEELLHAIQAAANFMRGMTMDPTVFSETKAALAARVKDLDSIVEGYHRE